MYFNPAKIFKIFILEDLSNYYKRNLETDIKKYLSAKEIIAIVGVRQCGKTTLMKKLASDLSDKSKINFISFDDVSILRLFEEDIKSFIQIHAEPYDYLFIDEIQYSPESGKKLKFIYDHYEIKIIISGSSAAEISIQSIKYLVGRIFTFTLFPFSFEEFLRVKNIKLLSVYNGGNYKQIIVEQLNDYLAEFLVYGGFPRVVTSSSFEEKQMVLKNILNTYLLREIRETFQLPENIKIMKLIKLLGFQIGNLINYNELSRQSEFKLDELKRILNILEKTFIISLVHPYYTNKRTELVKSQKIYFVDPGFRNICLESYSENQNVKGESIEQFIYSEFQKKGLQLKYWRSKSQAEVDFILEKEQLIPIEIKSALSSPKTSRSFHSFLSKYTCETSYILNEKIENSVKKENGQMIHFLPWVKFNTII